MTAGALALLTVVGTADGLDRTFASLVAQTDSRWQWCIAVAADAPSDTLDRVKRLIAGEPRATAVPGSAHFGELAMLAFSLARGSAVGWLDGGDLLDANAVRVAHEQLRSGSWIFTDEAAVDGLGVTVDVWFKPDYAPERLRSQPYALRFAVLPTDVVSELGGFRSEAGTAAWYDVVLRVAARLAPPVHVAGPYYLHGQRGAGSPYISGEPMDRCRVVSWAMQELGWDAQVSPIEVDSRPIGQRVRRIPAVQPRVSAIIPTRASSSMIDGFPRCHAVEFVRSLWADDRYPNLEVVIVYDQGTPEEALREISEITGGEALLVPFLGPFHFSRKCNAGALAASGDYLCFLNDDMKVVTPDWLHELASLLADPDVGAVGARLLFADGTLQHAGHEYNGGYPGHTLFRFGATDIDQGGAALVTSERSGVTGACMLLRAADYLQVGGFSEEFPLSYNDVDLSLKIGALGLRIIYTPHATLFHYESQTREAKATKTEIMRIRRRWSHQLQADPYLNELHHIAMDPPG